MAATLVNYDPAMYGSDGRTLPPGDGGAPQWPVLARLPYVGDDPSREALMSRGTASRLDSPHMGHGYNSEPAAPAFRIAAEANDYRSPSYEPVQPAEEVERWPNWRLASQEDQPLTPPMIEPALRRQHRVDSGHGQRYSPPAMAAPAPMRVVSPFGESQTVAARVFQWHAALAPYAGLAMTFVLALFAGLLYWSSFGKSSAPAAEATAIDAPAAPQWSAKVDAAPAAAQPLWPLKSAPRDALQSPLSGTPRINLNLPPLGEPAASSLISEGMAPSLEVESAPAVGSLSDDAKPLIDNADPSAAESADQEQTAATMPRPAGSGETTASTPTAPAAATAAPATITYPTTPFATFDASAAIEQGAPANSVGPASPY